MAIIIVVKSPTKWWFGGGDRSDLVLRGCISLNSGGRRVGAFV